MLGRLGDTRAFCPLVAQLDDSDNEIRYTAAEALGKLGDKRALGPLLAKLDELGYDYVIPPKDATPNGAIETLSDARVCSELFKETADKIDGIVVVLPNFGDELGVVQTLDFTGLDLVHQISKNFGFENEIIKERVEKGHLGAKTSKGIYDYGGRSEEEILRKRDELYIKMIGHLEAIDAFAPI